MELNLNDTINAQINTELWSAYLFLSMSVNASSKGLKGVSKWFYTQHQKELTDAKILIDYLNSTNKKVYLYPIEGVPTEWESPLNMFKHKLEHEQKISKLIHTIATMAEETKDYVSLEILTKLAKEQIKAESTSKELITAFEAVENNKYALYMLDKELGKCNNILQAQ